MQEGECVKAHIASTTQSWELNNCEALLPFVCSVNACSMGSKLCANGNCINEVSLSLPSEGEGSG